MIEQRSPAELATEGSSEETRSFVRRARWVTRRKFTPEEKVRIVLEGFWGEARVSELCPREGIRGRAGGPGGIRSHDFRTRSLGSFR